MFMMSTCEPYFRHRTFHFDLSFMYPIHKLRNRILMTRYISWRGYLLSVYYFGLLLLLLSSVGWPEIKHLFAKRHDDPYP